MVVPSLDDVHMRVLRVNTRRILSNSLNGNKVLPNGPYCRDWRGLAHLCGVTIQNQSKPLDDPTDYVLMKWQEQENPTIGQFFNFLERLDRYDVIADVEEAINQDVERYLHLRNSVGIRAIQEDNAVVNPDDDNVLTIDDVCRVERGLGPQIYDAFVLFADEEREDALELVDHLERDNFKLCLKDRDIVAGVSFEHKAIMTLIEERCFRVIVMLSPNFVECPSNIFFHLFTQSIQIEQRLRKVIPCICRNFPSRNDIPAEFRCYSSLRYDDRIRWPEHFWIRLKNSVKSPHYQNRINQISNVVLRELPNENEPPSPSSRNVLEILPHVVQDENRPLQSDDTTMRSSLSSRDLNLISSHGSLDDSVKENPIESKTGEYSLTKLWSALRLQTKKLKRRHKGSRRKDISICAIKA